MVVNQRLFNHIQEVIKQYEKLMYKITVKGDAEANMCGDDEHYELITDLSDLQQLEGIGDHDAEFSDYFHNGNYDGFVKGGQLIFHVEKGTLMATTVYTSAVKLDKDQLKHLMEYTQGQWSDGVGEGFEQNPCTQIGGNDVYISAWHKDQKIKISQKAM